MVNFGFNSASILGIFLALAGAGLYLLRSLRPEVSRDHDIFFAAVGLLCGGILLWHGWRLDPILQFSQLLLASSAIFFAVESIRLRGVATQQARGRTSSYVDDERPVRKVYRAELADQDFYEEEDDYYEEEQPVARRRLQGTAVKPTSRRSSRYEDESPRPPRRSSRRYDDSYEDESPASSRSSRGSRNYTTSRRRPSRDYSDWQDEAEETMGKPSRRGGYSSTGSNISEQPTRRTSRKRRPKSADDIVSSVGTEYVDYQPVDSEEDDFNEPNNNPDEPETTTKNYDY